MKKTIYILILTVMLTGCAEKIYLFNAKIASTDINGTKKYGPKGSAKISKLIKDPILTEPEYEYLGRLISSDNLRTDNGFFDFIYRKGDYGSLDKVYINFLDEVSIPKLPIGQDAIIDQFKSEFSDKSTYQEKKQVLFLDKYVEIRKILEKSTYRIISNDIVQNQKIEAIFKGGIESNVKAVLKESDIELTGEINAQLESIIKTNVDIKGKYVDIELVKEFSDNLIGLLGKLNNEPPSPSNTFARNYLNMFIGKKDFVAVGYSLLQFEIKYNTSKINKTEIKAIIDGVASLSETDKVNLTAKVYSSFSFSRDFSGESKSTKNYLVRYSYNSTMQGYNE
jgi:hypothetical protein